MEQPSDKKKIRIARIIARLNVGGPARHVVWLNEALQDDEFESILIAGTVPAGEEDMSYFAAERNVQPEYVEEMSRELSPFDLVALFKIWRKLVAFNPDIVHTHTAKAGTLGRIAAFLYRWITPATLIGRPRKLTVFHTFHGHIFHGYYGDTKTKVFLAVERILARFATDRIIAISSQQLEEINETYGVGKRDQFEVVPLGLDLKALDWNGNKTAFRSAIGVSEDEVLVGIVGRLTEIKNHRLFIDTARLFQESSDFSDIRFVIIGDGHLKNQLEEYSTGSGVIFAGNLDNAAEFYSALDIVVLTSKNEGTPLTLIEAMAAGKPWVAAAVGGVTDLAGRPSSSEFKVQSSKSVIQETPDKIDFEDPTNSELRTPNSELQIQNPELSSDPEPQTLNSESSSNLFSICERGILFQTENANACFSAVSVLLENIELRDRLAANGQGFVRKEYTKERLISDIKRIYKSESP